ncbi:MAG TPA: acyl-CoA dehydrogenase family protein [Candidatus Binatia bacterium]|nr:acyl-CoA dehydrogenase family protein [Candidatus Binatia bacterium]
MNFGLSEEQILFKQTLRRFVEERCPTSRVRAVMESDDGHDPALWQSLAELGLAGLTVPSRFGGAGLELLDLALGAEELGYGAVPGPFLGNALATIALVESEDEEQKARWLPKVAAGEALLTIAFGEEGSQWDPAKLDTRAREGAIRGTKPLVPYAAESGAMLVAAEEGGEAGLWLVDCAAPGVEIERLQVVDRSRRLATVVLRDSPGVKLRGGARALRRSLDAGAVLLAADAFGGAKRCLEMTVRYALERVQFGQPIGAFQAVKHQLANLACDLEPALSLWWYAAHAFDHIVDRSERHAALAKAHLTDLFDRAARECTELHGGIGFTWEYDLHLWFRRSVFDRSFLGEAAYHRERAATLAGW